MARRESLLARIEQIEARLPRTWFPSLPRIVLQEGERIPPLSDGYNPKAKVGERGWFIVRRIVDGRRHA